MSNGRNRETARDTNERAHSPENHESKSFEFLYASYGKQIYNLAYRMTGRPEDAEDITQETFLHVYHKLGDFRGESQLSTWIYAIAKNVCYQFLRREEHRSFASLETLLSTGLDSDWPDATQPFQEAERADLITQVKDGCLTGLICCLSLNQRIAFVLQTLLHLPVRDVAEILGKSEGATKVLICRAKANLKLFLCRNCSLYAPENRCHCERLVEFSLKQGWIQHRSAPVEPQHIEAEIRAVRSVIEIYSQLTKPEPSEELRHALQALIRSHQGILFTTEA